MKNENIHILKKITKTLFYLGLSGVKSFMSALIIIVGFFVERFFIAKYVDVNLSEQIIPIINIVARNWGKIMLVIWLFFWILAYRELKKSEETWIRV